MPIHRAFEGADMEKSKDTLRVQHEELERKISDMQQQIVILDFYRDSHGRTIDRRVAELNARIDKVEKRFPNVYNEVMSRVRSIMHNAWEGFNGDLRNVVTRLEAYQKESDDRTREQERINAAQKDYNRLANEFRAFNRGNIVSLDANIDSAWNAIMELRSKHLNNEI